jgi:alpha-pyrone synthase
MSSATILFVLKHILEKERLSGNQVTRESGNNETVLAVAFGPGLTVESALLEKITTRIRSGLEPESRTYAGFPLSRE